MRNISILTNMESAVLDSNGIGNGIKLIQIMTVSTPISMAKKNRLHVCSR